MDNFRALGKPNVKKSTTSPKIELQILMSVVNFVDLSFLRSQVSTPVRHSLH